MILQTQINNDWIKRYGCAFMCAYFWSLYYNRYYEFNSNIPENVIDTYAYLKKYKCFTTEGNIIWKKSFSLLGVDCNMVDFEHQADFCIYEWCWEAPRS